MASVLVPLAQGCEELESVTIIDLLRRAGIDVTTAGLDAQPVTASRGVVLIPDTTLDEALKKDYDWLIKALGDKEGWRYQMNSTDRENFTAAICAAPKVLASAGLLEGKRATAYPGTLEKLNLTNTTLASDPVVTDGKVTTSRGPGTAMDFALALIETLIGSEKREAVEAGLVRS